jgi:hypothetical protein
MSSKSIRRPCHVQQSLAQRAAFPRLDAERLGFLCDISCDQIAAKADVKPAIATLLEQDAR